MKAAWAASHLQAPRLDWYAIELPGVLSGLVAAIQLSRGRQRVRVVPSTFAGDGRILGWRLIRGQEYGITLSCDIYI